MTGKLVVFEGPDGSGKTTQRDLALGRLIAGGVNCGITRHPGGTKTGELLRAVIKDRDAAIAMPPLARRLIFTADRLTHMVELRKQLEEYDTILMDRWDGVSTSAYGVVEGNNTEESEFCLNIGVEKDVPVDLVLVFDVKAEVAWKRTDHEDLADSNWELFQRVNAAYAKFAREATQYGFLTTVHGQQMRAKRINANGSMDEVHQQVMEAIKTL